MPDEQEKCLLFAISEVLVGGILFEKKNTEIVFLQKECLEAVFHHPTISMILTNNLHVHYLVGHLKYELDFCYLFHWHVSHHTFK